MSLYTLPFLYLNLGGEMLYILRQRLGAEKINDQRQKKAMQDIVKHMLNDNVRSTLFTAQPLTTQKRLKANFFKLANASVININEASMEKLFDLMLMTFKYQLLLCKSGHELLLLTLNHLDALREMVNGMDQLTSMVNKTCSGLVDCFHSISEAQLMIARHTLLVFLQDCDRKISLFLSKGLQLSEGELVIPHGGKVPYGVQPPGMVRYLFSDHKVEMVTLWCNYEGMESKGCLDITGNRTVTIGQNLYSRKPSKDSMSTAKNPISKPKMATTERKKMMGNPTIAELDFIQNLLIGYQPPPDTSDFKLSLFDTFEDQAFITSSKPSHPHPPTTDRNTITIAKAHSKDHLKNVLDHFDSVTAPASSTTHTTNKDDDGGLLALMDNL